MTTFRSTGYDAYPTNPLYSGGKKLREVPFRETVAAASVADGDIFILAGALNLSSKIAHIFGKTPALTAAVDNDFGFYKKNEDGTFTALDADVLIDGQTLATALAYQDLLDLNTSLDRSKNIGELLGLQVDEAPIGGVYLAMTMNTASTATSEVLALNVMIEEATTI